MKRDILSRVPWDEADITALADLNLGEGGHGDIELRAGLESDPLFARTPDSRAQATSDEEGPD